MASPAALVLDHPWADLYSMLSSMSLPAKTASVPMTHTAMNMHSRMWSRTMATNFHSSAACNQKKLP